MTFGRGSSFELGFNNRTGKKKRFELVSSSKKYRFATGQTSSMRKHAIENLGQFPRISAPNGL